MHFVEQINPEEGSESRLEYEPVPSKIVSVGIAHEGTVLDRAKLRIDLKTYRNI